jgi:hypothetical protein
MSDKDKRKPDDPEQSKRFIDTAREIGADESEDGAERAFSKVARPKRPAPKGK